MRHLKHTFYKSLLISVILLTITGCAQNMANRIYRDQLHALYQSGIEAYDKGRYAEAISYLRDYFSLHADVDIVESPYFIAYKIFAQASIEAGNTDEAYWACTEGLKQKNDDSDLRNWLAWYNVENRKSENMPRIFPKEVSFLRNRGPRPIFQRYPEQPEHLRHLKGIVELAVFIDRKGYVSKVEVLKNSTGSEVLAANAVEAATQYIFTPALADSEPIPTVTKISFSFGRKDRLSRQK